MPCRAGRGLTLIELMVVITILGMLAGLIALNVADTPDRAAVALTKAQLVNLEQAIEQFKLDNRRLPDSLDV